MSITSLIAFALCAFVCVRMIRREIPGPIGKKLALRSLVKSFPFSVFTEEIVKLLTALLPVKIFKPKNIYEYILILIEKTCLAVTLVSTALQFTLPIRFRKKAETYSGMELSF